MPAPFAAWTLRDTDTALAHARDDVTATAHQFYTGEHWQNGVGWMGQRPDQSDPSAGQLIQQIHDGFLFENVIQEIVDRHLGGVLGHEPAWGFTVRRPLAEGEQPTAPEQALVDEAEAALTGEWWDDHQPLDALKDAARNALLGGRGVLRLHIPPGLRDQAGLIRALNLAAALDILYLDAPDPSAAMLVRDPATYRQVGVFRYRYADTDYAELTYVEDDGRTILRVLDGGGVISEIALALGGRLLMTELRRDRLATPAVLAMQKLVNLTRTMEGRSINMAGFRERNITNAQPAGHWVDATGREVRPDDPSALRFVYEGLLTGAGSTNFITGLPIYRDGEIQGYTNPNVNYGEPVKPDAFTLTRDDAYNAILGQVHQRHVLMSSDATASGESRKQARAEYEADLRLTANIVNDAGRWLLETTLATAAFAAGAPERFTTLRSTFSARVDAGPLSADEIKTITERYQAGLLSRETALALQGIDDVDAEVARIEEEDQAKQTRGDAAFANLVRTTTTPTPPAPPTPTPANPADLLRTQLGQSA